MSELLRRSIETLSSIVNVSTGFTHPLDEGRTKDLLKALHASGERLDFQTVEQLALENMWPARHAKALAELAQRIANGGRVRIEHGGGWGELTVARLKAAIKSGEASQQVG